MTTIERVKNEVRPNTPETLVETLASHLDIIERCRKRIEEEGEVVRNPKAEAIPHPSLKTMQEETKLYAELILKVRRS